MGARPRRRRPSGEPRGQGPRRQAGATRHRGTSNVCAPTSQRASRLPCLALPSLRASRLDVTPLLYLVALGRPPAEVAPFARNIPSLPWCPRLAWVPCWFSPPAARRRGRLRSRPCERRLRLHTSAPSPRRSRAMASSLSCKWRRLSRYPTPSTRTSLLQSRPRTRRARRAKNTSCCYSTTTSIGAQSVAYAHCFGRSNFQIPAAVLLLAQQRPCPARSA